MPCPLHFISVTVKSRSIAGLRVAPDADISLKGAGKKKAETSKTATNTVSAHSVSKLTPGELAAPVNKLILKIHDCLKAGGDQFQVMMTGQECPPLPVTPSKLQEAEHRRVEDTAETTIRS